MAGLWHLLWHLVLLITAISVAAPSVELMSKFGEGADRLAGMLRYT